MPIAAWEFNGDLKDAIGSLHLKAHGKISYNGGAVVLKNSYLQSNGLPFDLKAKTLEVFCTIQNIDMKGGGLMGIQGPGDFFDTIVIGERKDEHWISGSNGFARTNDFQDLFQNKKPTNDFIWQWFIKRMAQQPSTEMVNLMVNLLKKGQLNFQKIRALCFLVLGTFLQEQADT